MEELDKNDNLEQTEADANLEEVQEAVIDEKIYADEVNAEEFKTEVAKSPSSIKEKSSSEPFFEDEAETKQFENLLLKKHLSTALGNMTIVLVAFVFVIFIAQITAALGAFLIAFLLGTILFLLTIATLGLIYLTGVMGSWWAAVGKIFNGGADFVKFLEKFYVLFPFVIALSAVFSVFSIVLEARSGVLKSVGRIVCSAIFGALAVLMSIIILTGVLSS